MFLEIERDLIKVQRRPKDVNVHLISTCSYQRFYPRMCKELYDQRMDKIQQNSLE